MIPDRALQRDKARQGFTMIEIIAVVAIFAMIFAIGIPQLNTSKKKILKNEAENLAASFEYARQRAVMTGVSHRVLIDLENGAYRTEWWVSEEEAYGALEDGNQGFGLDLTSTLGGEDGGDGSYDARSPLDLFPPERAERDFYPVPNRQLGAFTWLHDAVYFVGLDGSSGWIESNEVQIVFSADGTTDFALLELADSDENHRTLEIEPILNRVRQRDGEARS
ncbi:MAG: Tfp pilus assembly protein FimT/FimU [Myxococcota bacterium]